jgi:serine protein kinase
MKDLVVMTTAGKMQNEEQQKRLRTVQDTLVEEQGYCSHCAEELIRYAGAMLNRAGS